MLTRKPPAAQQNSLTLFALAHPIWLAIISGAMVALWTGAVVGDKRAVAVAGGLTAILVWSLWNRRGPARRRETRIHNDSVLRNSDQASSDQV